jgi:hypothetical protein
MANKAKGLRSCANRRAMSIIHQIRGQSQLLPHACAEFWAATDESARGPYVLRITRGRGYVTEDASAPGAKINRDCPFLVATNDGLDDMQVRHHCLGAKRFSPICTSSLHTESRVPAHTLTFHIGARVGELRRRIRRYGG